MPFFTVSRRAVIQNSIKKRNMSQMSGTNGVQKVRQILQDTMRRRGLSVEEAARDLSGVLSRDLIKAAVQQIREEGRRNQMLRVPGGMESLEYKQIRREAAHRRWYTGPDEENDVCWPAFRRSLTARLGSEAVDSIDQASTKIVSYLGDPGVHGLQTKGLVIGHVQSGKTSNYTAVVAKAADAGYRLIIVLSGMYNALRQQTQRRLNGQLVDQVPEEIWVPLTGEERDFGRVLKGGALLSQPDLRLLVVTKKNMYRLERLCGWLDDMTVDTRRRCPALIIDDEADQATPNTGDSEEDRSRINSLVVRLLELLPTSSYVGYTATPFANVFIDPEARDLYPNNFIISLPRPEGYFGAEAIFGRTALDDGDNPDDGYDMVREVTSSEAGALRPPRNADEREAFQPTLQPSLSAAIRYFILASAARRERGQTDQHSSMLIHTTQYSAVHLRQRDEVRAYVDSLRRQVANGDRRLTSELRAQWDRETDRVKPEDFQNQTVAFDQLAMHLSDVLRDVKVIADNYISDDRLDYTETTTTRDGEEVPVQQTVIAVGGNTLSRGLTLEGLLVSYFIRSGRAYDTLLQMGRWFGFRPGYEDLPRVWMTAQLRRQFRFLATIEEEIRLDVERYEREGMKPDDYGVRVRCHPDLMITAPSKMRAIETVSLSYSGDRLQTFLFRHRDEAWLQQNIDAASSLITAARRSGASILSRTTGKFVLQQVHYERIIEFLENYQFHEDHGRLRSDLLINYIENRLEHASELEWWNVAVMGGRTSVRNVEGEEVRLGTIDLGAEEPIPLINRAPLKDSLEDRADIKALMSRPDRVVDLDIDPSEVADMNQAELQLQRPDDVGLLLIYPISKDSVPMGASRLVGSRKNLNAAEHVIGVGLVFPESRRAQDENPSYEYDYVAVKLPDEDPMLEEDEAVELDRLDTEEDAVVDPDVPEVA